MNEPEKPITRADRVTEKVVQRLGEVLREHGGPQAHRTLTVVWLSVWNGTEHSFSKIIETFQNQMQNNYGFTEGETKSVALQIVAECEVEYV